MRRAGKIVPPALRPAAAWWVRPWLYRGDRVSCPCCGGRFGSFMPHRDVPQVRCPRCGAMERHRLLSLYLDANPRLLSGELSVLHVAPEYALKRRLSRMPNLRYTTGDLDSPQADLSFDLQQAPFPDESFDVVFCNHVLEHVGDDRRAMREIRRILRPGGLAVLMCPIGRGLDATIEDSGATTPGKRLKKFGQEDHLRLYGTDYFERLAEAGFSVKSLSLEDVASMRQIERHKLRRHSGLFRDDELILCGVS